jgi:hypothetical protein
MKMTTFITNYDFRRDKRQIERMQNASLHLHDWGLVTKQLSLAQPSGGRWSERMFYPSIWSKGRSLEST